jgi:hypothetical protein
VPEWSSNNNAVLIDNCESLQNLTVTLRVTQDLITQGNVGFSLQLNTYPQPGTLCQGEPMNWLQYVIFVTTRLLMRYNIGPSARACRGRRE